MTCEKRREGCEEWFFIHSLNGWVRQRIEVLQWCLWSNPLGFGRRLDFRTLKATCASIAENRIEETLWILSTISSVVFWRVLCKQDVFISSLPMGIRYCKLEFRIISRIPALLAEEQTAERSYCWFVSHWVSIAFWVFVVLTLHPVSSSIALFKNYHSPSSGPWTPLISQPRNQLRHCRS